MKQLEILRRNRDEIYRIARNYRVKRLFVIGSCARGEETPKSDIDFLVQFEHGSDLFNHFDFERQMRKFLKRRVDAVSIRALRDDAFKRSIRRDMIKI